MTDHTGLVRRMQRFLQRGVEAGRDVGPDDLAALVGYSRRHCERLFREYTGHSVQEYVRLLRLTSAARRLAEEASSVLDVALDSRYESHEGFTKAFVSAFGVAPAVYRRGGRAIPYFIPYPANPAIQREGEIDMSNTPVVTASYLERPARKLLFLPSARATDYFSFCEGQGCEWEGMMASIPEKLDAPALVTLPDRLIPRGKAPAAAGVELPLDWAGLVPSGYELVDLAAGAMLELRSQPYKNEEDYCVAIEQVFAAFESYDPALYGYRFAPDTVPLFNFGAHTDEGARIMVPVERTR